MKADTQGSILTALGKGAYIFYEQINEPPSAVWRGYRLSSNNRAIRRQLVERLLADGLIRPTEDALFDGLNSTSQTFVLARSSDKVE